MNPIFCGYDSREAIGYQVFSHSLINEARRPAAMVALSSRGMPVGSNAFTVSRFLVPHLCKFKGRAVFLDASDMLLRADIAELFDLFDPKFAVQVVRHSDYTSRHQRKYIGSVMETAQSNYERKNWASVMLINCAHPAWRDFSPTMVSSCRPLDLLQFVFFKDELIGALPNAWNRLVDEGQSVAGAKLLHFTAGLPCLPAYAKTPGAGLWHAQLAQIQQSLHVAADDAL